MRGYNLSSKPDDVAAYDTGPLAADIRDLIHERGAETALLYPAGMLNRAKFWWSSVTRGVIRLNDAAGWVGLVVLVLGVAAGIAVPLVFSLSHWVTAVVLMGLFIVILLEGTYSVWYATDQQRAALASSQTQRLARANLDFELRVGGVELFLFIRNLGPAEARAISVSGKLDNGSFAKIPGVASIIQPNAEHGVYVNPSGFYILDGLSRWDLEVDWEDGTGSHEKESFTATRRRPQA
jgi:hypothetical protein